MELSPARQRLLFIAIVVLLAALGYYLVVPALRHRDTAAPAKSPTPAATSATAATSAPAAPAATVSPAGSVNIYNWLPFTQADLAAAAQVTVRFSTDYDTYRYTESADAYVGAMNGLISSELAATLRNGYTTVGVAQLRTSQQEVSTGTATIAGIRAFGSSSLTFLVNISQRLATVRGTTSRNTRWAVTLTGPSPGWQVNDIELATEGNT